MTRRQDVDDGQVSLYPHTLAPREEFNNSFATVSPDERWMVSGEWNLENEGIDFNRWTRLLTITMNQPGACDTTTSVDLYKLRGAREADCRRGTGGERAPAAAPAEARVGWRGKVLSPGDRGRARGFS